jgi:putative DNA primase/helicase
MNTNPLISLFPNALAAEPSEAITLQKFLTGVREGTWARKIEVLREHIARGDRPRYDNKKRELPAVTISCHCLSRERDLSPEAKDVTHSGFLQADFDLKDNTALAHPDIVAAKRAALIADPHVIAVFVGPSGEGLKAVVSIDTERHKDSWFAAEVHFREVHGLKLDPATKDPMRLCFVSHDPDLATSDEAKPLAVPDKLPEPEVWRPPLETTAEDVAEMLKVIPPRPDYETWLRIASAVWSVVPMADGCRLLHQWSPEEKPGEYAGKHKARLHQIGIGTLVHIASQHGFDARAAWRRRRWAGRIRFAESVRGPGQEEDPAADTAPQDIYSVELDRERVWNAFNNGQTGDARLWCQLRRGLRVWNIHAKSWMIYMGGIWGRDTGQATTWDISDTLCRIYGVLGDTIRAEIAANPADEPKKDPRVKELVGINARIDQLHTSLYLSGVEKLAAKELHLPATAFNANPDILVVANGTLDFAEGVFREHRSTDYVTIRSGIAFDPSADSPRWHAFLDRCIPDPETRVYLARAIGYCLTGRVNHDALFFLYGKGANGKSTFVSVIKLLLGELMTTVPIAALLAAKSDSNFDYHKASMEGKRVVCTDEIPEGRQLAENQVKAITGGDAVNARRPFEVPYTFYPTHKLVLMGNHKPDIKGTDEGIWRRVHMIPFLVTIPKAEQRPRHEVYAEFEAEAAGILNWALRGLLESRDIGLCPPEQVVEATKEYREESDQFGTFLAECTVPNINGKIAMSSLAQCYSVWCDQNKEMPRHRGTRALKKVMIERGYTVELDRNKHPNVMGAELKTEEADNVLNLQN